jgi:oxygen-dependent protoporphyrinogen oxidase
VPELPPAPRYRLRLEDGRAIEVGAVVLAGHAHDSARVLAPVDADLSELLAGIDSAPLAVVCLGFVASGAPFPLDGFGFLVPRGEGPRILGCLWDSSIYPGRALAGKALLRAMIGGAHDREAAALPDATLVETVRADLRATMGLAAEPEFIRIFRHTRGIPQYTVGHLHRLDRIEAALGRWPGLHLAGNSYRGIAMNACIAEAGPLAERLLIAT